MTTVELIKLGAGLFTFFGAQMVAAWFFFRREKAQDKRAREEDRRHQLKQMKEIIDKDIGEIREDLRVVDDRHTKNYAHIRETRPTRPEMEREIQMLRNILESQGNAQQNTMAAGFEAINRRFDEFKEYMKDLHKHK